MQYFTQDFIQFYIDLSRNNNKDWFHENKQRFETSVREPFSQLISDVISEINKFEKLDISAKECMFRYNRDIRFSQEKHPYNLHISAAISAEGRKDKGAPGVYLRFTPEETGIMGGTYCTPKEDVDKIRAAIAKNPAAFKKTYSDQKFVSAFGELLGDEIKRIPKELKEAFEKEPLIARKQFYFTSIHPVDLLLSDTLFETIMEHYHASKPVNDFLKKAII